MAEKKPYDPKLDKEVFCVDFVEEKMRVRGYSYDGHSPKIKLTPIYQDKNGNTCVETTLGANGRYIEKLMFRLTVPQVNRLFRFIQEKIQNGDI